MNSLIQGKNHFGKFCYHDLLWSFRISYSLNRQLNELIEFFTELSNIRKSWSFYSTVQKCTARSSETQKVQITTRECDSKGEAKIRHFYPLIYWYYIWIFMGSCKDESKLLLAFTDETPLKLKNTSKALKTLFKRVNLDNKLYNMALFENR